MKALLPFLLLLAVLRAQPQEPADTVQAALGVLQVGWKDNYTAAALEKKGHPFTVITADTVSRDGFSFSAYDIVFVNEWWTAATRSLLNAQRDSLRAYVEQGGILTVFYSLNNLCDIDFWTSSWTPFDLYVTLNNDGSDCRRKSPVFKDQIELEGHPVFNGFKKKHLKVGARKAFRTSDAHWYVVAKNREREEPTLLEATSGEGRYVVAGQELAYWYGKRYQETRLFDNILAYADMTARRIKKDRLERERLRRQDSLRTAQTALPPSEASAAEPAPAEAEPVYTEPEPVYSEPSPVPEPEPEVYTEPEPESEPVADEPIPEQAAPEFEILPLSVANNWVFNNGSVWSITGTRVILNKTVYSLNFSSGLGMYYIGLENDGVYLYGSSEDGVDNLAGSPQIMFRYPAAVGDAYSTELTIGGGAATITVTDVSAQVETDIGTFSCYEYTVERDGGTQVWYLCPEIGFVSYAAGDEEVILNDYVIN